MRSRLDLPPNRPNPNPKVTAASSVSKGIKTSRISIVPAPTTTVRGTTATIGRLSATATPTPLPRQPAARSGAGAVKASSRPLPSQWAQTPKVARTHPRPLASSEHSTDQHGNNTSAAAVAASATTTTPTTTTTTKTTPDTSTTYSSATTSSSPAVVVPAASAPLRSSPDTHKHHVISVTVKPRSSPPSVTNMPVGDRPRHPQLSATAARAINRTPLTPKIAAKGLPVTPLARRANSSTPPSAASNDVSSPVSAFIATNITPRSGPRQIRVDSANSTPSAVKAGDQWDANTDHSNNNNNNNNNTTTATNRAGLGIIPPPADHHPRQQPAPYGATASDSNDSSKFFYASDARSIQQTAPQRPASVPQKSAATFFYANQLPAETGRNASPPSNGVPGASSGQAQEPAHAKFFFANGSPDLSPRPNLVLPGPGSTISTSSRMGSFGPAASGTKAPSVHQSQHPPQRPASPVKTMSTPVTQTLKTTTTSPTSPRRPSLVSSPPVLHHRPSFASQRRVSIDVGHRETIGHKRAGSAHMAHAEPLTLSKSTASPRPSETTTSSPPASPGLTHHAMSMASILQAAEDLREDEEVGDGVSQAETQSPTKSHFDDSISELVANARRERKVQDLQITNASLEAINRTLERQLRKQTLELRRYRRLSRSGALSAASSRVTSLALTEPSPGMSDVDETEDTEMTEDEDEDEDDEDDDTQSLDDSDLSSNASFRTQDVLLPDARLDARRRRDERRLQLDLSKHQELLIDSQKMNQSLKRCLDFTQVLIKEGQKALEYKVRVSDVKLGGRVLAPPDEEDEEARTGDAGLAAPPWPKSSQDRDSGIELPPPEGR